MSLDFDEDVWMFISLAQKHNVKMLMVGGGAVNFYGYQRHSADVDFWIDTTPSNLVALREALNELGYEFDDFPEDVKRGQQNISIKISPVIDIELITSFNPGRSFSECYEQRLTATNTINDSVSKSVYVHAGKILRVGAVIGECDVGKRVADHVFASSHRAWVEISA